MSGALRSYSVPTSSGWMLVLALAVLAPHGAGQTHLSLPTPSFEPRTIPPWEGNAVPVLAPGASLSFELPDAVDGVADAALIGLADVITDETPLRAYAMGNGPLQTSTATLFQYNDVEIAESAAVSGARESVLVAQVSGATALRGFLFGMMTGTASASVDVRVIDVTDLDAPLLVHCHNVASYSAEGGFSAGIGGGVDVQGMGGFPFVGVAGGGSIEAGVEAPLTFVWVEEELDFGFQVLLRRGHVYRIQLELSQTASLRLFGGTAIASFSSQGLGGPVIPNPLDPDPLPATKGAENTWLSLLTPKAGAIPNLTLQKNDADVTNASVDVGGGSFALASVWNQSIADVINPLNFGFPSGGEGLKQLQGHDMFSKLFGTPPLSIGQLVTNSPFLDVKNDVGREELQEPGVAMAGLTVTLDSDRLELNDDAVNRTIEENLAAGRRLASLYLPEEFGGRLERCRAIVLGHVANAQLAGQDTSKAESFVAKSLLAQDEAKFKTAYRHLHIAYDLLTRGP